jgi:type IV pilus assembly protein PilA
MSDGVAANTAATSTASKKKGNGLAITALVLSALFFLPFIPFIGLILGIIALATGRSKPISIVAICLGAFFTLIIGVEAAVAIPAFMKYIRRSKTVEATMNTRRLADAIAMQPALEWARLAESDWTPAGTACEHPGNRFVGESSTFAAEPWHTLGFSVDGPFYYQYRVRRIDHGFAVEARGDLDCDGRFSHFERDVAADGVSPLTSSDDLE